MKFSILDDIFGASKQEAKSQVTQMDKLRIK